MKKNNPNLSLLGPFTRLAKAMSRNFDIEVVPSGFACNTDGVKRINIPFNADHLAEAHQQVLHGLLDHEVQHVIEEREARERRAAGELCSIPSELMKACGSNRERLLLNVFEDVRIETKASKTWPGVAENLRRANMNSVENIRARTGEDGGDNFWHQLASGIILQGLGYDTSWMKPEMAPFMEAVQPEIEQSRSIKSVEESHDLALSVMKKVEDMVKAAEEEKARREEEKAKEEPALEAEEHKGDDGSDGADTDDSGDDEAESSDDSSDEGAGDDVADAPEGDDTAGDEGEPGEDDAAGEAAGGDEAGESDAAEGEDATSGGPTDAAVDGGDEDAADATGEGEGGAESGAEGADAVEVAPSSSPMASLSDEEVDAIADATKDSEDEHTMTELMDAVKEAIEDEAAHDAAVHSRYIPDPEIAAMDRWVKPREAPEAYQRLRDAAMPQVSALRAKLLSVLRTRAQARFTSDHERGQVDTSALYSLRTGNKRVFAQKTPESKVETAVTVLIDLSGSMGISHAGMTRAQYAAQMAAVLSETFDALHIPFEVIGFHNAHVSSSVLSKARRSMATGLYKRYLPFEFFVYKAFTEAFKTVRARLGSISPMQENVDGEAVLAAAMRLAERTENRKMLFVLSDGQPAGGCEMGAAKAHLGEVVRRITQAGIEVYGIGAASDSVKEYYNKANGASNVVIRDVSKLAVEVFKLVRERLLSTEAA